MRWKLYNELDCSPSIHIAVIMAAALGTELSLLEKGLKISDFIVYI